MEDQQFVAGDLLPEAEQLLLIAGFDQLADQRGCDGEAHAVPSLAGGQAKSQCDVRFPSAAVAEQQNVLTASEELASRQFQHQGLVHRRDSEEVDAVQGFYDWGSRL